MKTLILLISSMTMVGAGLTQSHPQSRPMTSGPRHVYAIDQGFVDANGVLIYYEVTGKGAPLVIVHGGPGASQDYFLPYLLPPARDNCLVFIVERGSGRSASG